MSRRPSFASERRQATWSATRSLFKTGAITDSQFTDTKAAADTAAAELDAVRSEARTADLQIAVAAARAAAAQTQAAEKASDLDYSKLQRSYAAVTAPIAGLVSRKNVEPGQFIQAGQTLLSVGVRHRRVGRRELQGDPADAHEARPERRI